MNIKPNTITEELYILSLEVEKLPASVQQTKVVILIGEIMNKVDRLEERCERLNYNQSVCHCGIESINHNAVLDGHNPVPLEEPCPYYSDLVEINKILKRNKFINEKENKE